VKHFVSAGDAGDIEALVQKALAYKAQPLKDQDLGRGKTLGLLFMNPSLRTRVSTQLAAQNLGLDAIALNADKDGWQLEVKDGAVMDGTSAEHVKEAAAVMGQYFSILGVRTFPGLSDRDLDYSEHILKQFVKYAGVPVLSLESATVHPLQSLADAVTIREHCPSTRKPKVVLTWAPHVRALPQAVPNSFAQWMNAWGHVELVIAHPPGYELDERFSGGARIETDQEKALDGADFVYVKNWSSFREYGKILRSDSSWMITAAKLRNTNKAKVMHCLPVRRNVVIADEVLDGPNSIVIQQAGNRVWSAQAVLSELLRS
jgi:N-succinyl-L-ornithine transcarbamylase